MIPQAIPPFQGFLLVTRPFTQGFDLGYHISPFQGFGPLTEPRG
jgi:hypothetical protein